MEKISEVLFQLQHTSDLGQKKVLESQLDQLLLHKLTDLDKYMVKITQIIIKVGSQRSPIPLNRYYKPINF